MKIPTKDAGGNPNGYVIPVWSNLLRPEFRPEQVYLTAVAPGCKKGPHLHKVRRGLFCCIKGNVRIRMRFAEVYLQRWSGDNYDHQLVEVPAGVPAAIYNDGPEEALVLNMPAPAWSAEDQDEWPVEDWVD